MTIKSFIACLLCLCGLWLLSGCNNSAPPPPPPPPPSPSLPLSPPKTEPKHAEEIPFSGMSYSDYKADPGLGAYGYALLPASVTDSSKKRLLKFASAFVSNLPNYNNGKAASVDPADVMITYWLVKVPRASNIAFNAANLVQLYDNARAIAMLSAVNKLQSAGPVLVAWQKPFEQLTGDDKNHYLSFDLSAYSDEDMERAVRVWRDMLCTGVSNWNNTGIGLLKFKEEVRNLLQSAGPDISDLISKR